MWIRSQDKAALIKSDCIILNKNEISATAQGTDGFTITIDEYSSQEKKALKVFDMIQECINHNNSHHNARIGIPYLEYNVFQMPLDSEVEEND